MGCKLELPCFLYNCKNVIVYMAPPKKVLLKDIAGAVGVSTALVSFVLNGKGDEFRVGEDTARKINALFPDRPLYLFDTFEGFDARDVEKEKAQGFSQAEKGEFSDTSPEAVLSRLPFPERAIVRQGYFPETAAGLEAERFALVSLDADLFSPILAGLEFFYPRLNPGGAILLHDFDSRRFPGAGKAVEAYEKAHGPLPLVPLCDLHGSAVIVRDSFDG